jgi:hypothetical protein
MVLIRQVTFSAGSASNECHLQHSLQTETNDNTLKIFTHVVRLAEIFYLGKTQLATNPFPTIARKLLSRV